MTTDIISTRISTFITSQFPLFLKEDNNQSLIEFIQLYYEWLELEGNPTDATRSFLTDIDVDTAPQQFLNFLRDEFLSSFPRNIATDPRFLIKNISSFFKAKGTEQSYKLLFAILFNEGVDFYYPGRDVLRASDGKWIREQFMQIVQGNNAGFSTTLNQITGRTSNAQARYERIVQYYQSSVLKTFIYVSQVKGNFVPNEILFDPTTGSNLAIVVTDVQTEAGKWKGTDGFLSSDKYLQDNFYYQQYSYVIKSNLTLDKYQTLAEGLVHPVGTKMFGEYDDFTTIDLSLSNASVTNSIGYDSATSNNSTYDTEIEFNADLTGDAYTLLNTGGDLNPNLSGLISTSSNSSIGYWQSANVQSIGPVPITLLGNRSLIQGDGNTTFTVDFHNGDTMIILDMQNHANTSHSDVVTYSNAYLQIADVYPNDFASQHYKKQQPYTLYIETDMYVTFTGPFADFSDANNSGYIVTLL